MTDSNKIQGLRQRIKQAQTLEEVQSLMKEGKTYKWASKATRSAWTNAANNWVEKSHDERQKSTT